MNMQQGLSSSCFKRRQRDTKGSLGVLLLKMQSMMAKFLDIILFV